MGRGQASLGGKGGHSEAWEIDLGPSGVIQGVGLVMD